MELRQTKYQSQSPRMGIIGFIYKPESDTVGDHYPILSTLKRGGFAQQTCGDGSGLSQRGTGRERFSWLSKAVIASSPHSVRCCFVKGT